MGDRIKVLFTIGSMCGGGAERVVSILANAFVQENIDVCIGFIGRHPVNTAYALDPRIEVVGIHVEKGGKIGQLLRLRAKIKEFAPDIIVGFMSYIAVQTMVACLGLNIPFVYKICSTIKVELGMSILRLLARLFYPFARGGVYQTEEQRSHFMPSKRRIDRVISNPLPKNVLWDTLRTNIEKRIIAVGRLDMSKNYPVMLRAFAEIAADFPDYDLEICGDGPLRPQLETLVADLGIRDQVVFSGFVQNVDKRIFSSALYVLSSDHEGTPNAMMEALCLGVPCVTTDYDGGSSHLLLEDGESGFITPKGDVEAFASAMRALLSDDALARSMGEKAKRLRERVCADVVIAQWISFIKECIMK